MGGDIPADRGGPARAHVCLGSSIRLRSARGPRRGARHAPRSRSSPKP